MDTRLRMIITGRVQGVGYRAWFRTQAQGLHLSGWVRNRRDGSVEAEVSGAAELVDLLRTLAERGPSMAQVRAVVPAEPEHDPEPRQGMEIRPTV